MLFEFIYYVDLFWIILRVVYPNDAIRVILGFLTEGLCYNLGTWSLKDVAFLWQGLSKDTVELHYEKCRIQGFWSLTHTSN